MNKKEFTELEKKHGNVSKVIVEATDKLGELVMYLKKPSRPVLKLALQKLTTHTGLDTFGMGEIIIKNCQVAGDDVLDKDEDFFRACNAACMYAQKLAGFF